MPRVVPVTSEGEDTSLGTSGGGLVGSSLGRIIGDGNTSRGAGAVGAVGGAVVGREVEKAATEENRKKRWWWPDW